MLLLNTTSDPKLLVHENVAFPEPSPMSSESDKYITAYLSAMLSNKRELWNRALVLSVPKVAAPIGELFFCEATATYCDGAATSI